MSILLLMNNKIYAVKERKEGFENLAKYLSNIQPSETKETVAS